MGEDFHMIQKKKKIVNRIYLSVLLIVLAMTSVLAGCGSGKQSSQSTQTSQSTTGASGSDSTTNNSGKTVKLTLWSIATDLDQQMIRDETDKFNKSQSEIQVTPQFFENDPYKDKLRIALGSGNAPDIFFNWGGGPLADYVKAGQVADLTDLLNNQFVDYKNRFPDSVWGPATVDGKIYGIPTEGSAVELLYYNKALFEKYNLNPPETWNDLLNAIKVLKENGIAPIVLEGKSQWPEMIWVQYLTMRIGGPQVFEKIAKGEPDAWSDPAVFKALEIVQELVDMGAFQNGYASMDAGKNQAEAMLASDKAAMLAQGSWVYNTILNNYPEMIEEGKLGFVPFPTIDPQYSKSVVGAPSAYFSISSNTESVEAALTYLSQVNYNDAEVDILINKLGQLPPVKGVEDKLKASPNADFQLWMYDLIAEADTVQLYWDQYLSATTAKILLDNISKLFVKQITPQQFVDNMNETLGK